MSKMSSKENRARNIPLKSGVQKQVIRNVAINAPMKKVTVIKHSGSNDDSVASVDIVAHQKQLRALNRNDNKLGAPQLHSTLAIVKKFEDLHLGKSQPAQSLCDLTSRMKAVATEKVKIPHPNAKCSFEWMDCV